MLLFTPTAFLCFVPKMMPLQFSLGTFLPSKRYSYIIDHSISLTITYPSFHSKESPVFLSKLIFQVFKIRLSHLVVSWEHSTFQSHWEEILLAELKYNPVGLHCCYVRHSNMQHYCFWDLSPPILSFSYCVCTSSWFITIHGFTKTLFYSSCKALWHF